MPSRRLSNVALIGAMLAIWVGVVTVAVGTFSPSSRKSLSEYEEATVRQWAAANHGHDLGGLGATAAFALGPALEAAFCAFAGIAFTSVSAFVWGVSKSHPALGSFCSGAFCCGCLIGAWSGIGAAIENAQWSLTVRAAGYSWTVIGLVLGAAAAALLCYCRSHEHLCGSQRLPV
jgi:hypothetical protein